MTADELALRRAIRALRNDLRSMLDLLESDPTHLGWWDVLRARERDLVRCFSELHAEEPVDDDPTRPCGLPQPALATRLDPWGDEDE